MNAIKSISRPSICIDSNRVRRRGTADIELMLAMPLLILILLMIVATLYIHLAREQTHQSAVDEAFAKAQILGGDLVGLNFELGVSPATLALENPPPEIPPISAFPNRILVGRSSKAVKLWLGEGTSLPQVTVDATAAVAAPSWTWNGWPDGLRDASPVRSWHRRIVSDSIAGVKDRLNLPEE